MKNSIVALAATLAVLGTSSPSVAANRDDIPNRTVKLAEKMKCERLKVTEFHEASDDNTAATCVVKRHGVKQRFYLIRYDEITPAVDWFLHHTVASSTSGWGSREASCFVKRGRHVIYPTGVRGSAAGRWCAYTQRRIGGTLYQGT